MPKLRIKGRPGSRQIRIGDGEWLPIDDYIRPAKLPEWVRMVALYLNGPDSDVRLSVLRAIAKEQRWEITGEFIDQGDYLGQAYMAFSNHGHNHRLPREEWAKYY